MRSSTPTWNRRRHLAAQLVSADSNHLLEHLAWQLRQIFRDELNGERGRSDFIRWNVFDHVSGLCQWHSPGHEQVAVNDMVVEAAPLGQVGNADLVLARRVVNRARAEKGSRIGKGGPLPTALIQQAAQVDTGD